MKQTQRDIKYIIKRILIGVGITIVLFNLKKCNVYALNSSDYYFYSTNSTTNLPNFSTSKPCTSSSNSCYHLVDSLEYDNSNIHFYYYNYNNRYHDGFMYLFQYNNNYYIFATYYNATNYDYSNIAYLKMSVNETALRYPPNLYAYDSNDESIGNFATSTTLNNPVPAYPFAYKFYTVDFDNISISENSSYSLANNILSTGELLATNTDIPTYYGDRLLNQQDPLANYTQLDLTGYEGVLLVPKDYQTMQENFSRTEQPVPGTFITYLDLDFYSQNCIRSTLINLTNVNDLMTNNIGTSVGGLAGSISGTCTDEPFQTILSYRYDMLSGMIPMGIMVYNNEIITGTYNNGFGTSYVWYNPAYYDYYLIESVADFNETISFTDFDGTEKDLHVEKIPNFEEMANYVLEHSQDLDKGKINSILGYSKITIPFLNKLKLYSCEAIRMPFPWSNSIMIMPCMSTLYNNVIPTAMIGVISVIINGLLIYRAIISIIGTYLDLARPDTTKLEVLDL